MNAGPNGVGRADADVARGADVAPWGDPATRVLPLPPIPPPPPLPPAGATGGQAWPVPSSPRRTALALAAAGVVAGLVIGGGGAGALHAWNDSRDRLPDLTGTPLPAPSATAPAPTPTGAIPTPRGSREPGRPGSSATATPSPTAARDEALAAGVLPSVVDVNTELRYQGKVGAGTGMVLTESGDILTNNHVIRSATRIWVRLVSTGRSYPATVVGTDAADDVAVIRVTGVSGLVPITPGNSDAVSVGDRVVAVGNALGAGGMPSIVGGKVVALNRSIAVTESDGGTTTNTLHGLIQTTAPLQPGDSGGPMLDGSGRVIGVDTAASADNGKSGSSPEGYAVPINLALRIAGDIRAGKSSDRIRIGVPAFLGVQFSKDAPATGGGVSIGQVVPGSPADQIGMGTGDLVTALDGRAPASVNDLIKQLHTHKPGDTVTIGWTDTDGHERTNTVTLVAGPPD